MTQIAIRYVNPAKPGKKYGSVKDSAGNTFWVPKDMVAAFQANTTVDVPTNEQTWGDNVVQVVTARPTAAQQAAASEQAATHDAHKDAQIFICAVVGRAMGSGKFETQDVPLLAKAALAAWNEIKGQL